MQIIFQYLAWKLIYKYQTKFIRIHIKITYKNTLYFKLKLLHLFSVAVFEYTELLKYVLMLGNFIDFLFIRKFTKYSLKIIRVAIKICVIYYINCKDV